MSGVRVSAHAARRWRQLVERTADLEGAAGAVRAFVRGGTVSGRPPAGVFVSSFKARARFVTGRERPDVVVVLEDELDGPGDVVVTVLVLAEPAQRAAVLSDLRRWEAERRAERLRHDAARLAAAWGARR